MIVWINGMSGAGKTAVARELLQLWPDGTLFEPRALASALPGTVSGPLEDSPAWRKTVADAAAALLSEVPGPLVVPMELLAKQNRDEIFGLIAGYGLPLHHVLLDADETILRTHLNGRASDRLDAYRAALPWLRADAYPVAPGDAAAHRIAAAVGAGLTRCDIVRTPKREGDTTAAAVLLFDSADRVLLVDPTYKAGWEFPGGVVEPGEPPSVAASRELEEELGLTLAPELLRPLLVDWEAAPPGRHGGLRLIFDGGTLDPAATAGLRLPAAELRSWRFVTPEEAGRLLPAPRAQRLTAALAARKAGRLAYTEAGA